MVLSQQIKKSKDKHTDARQADENAIQDELLKSEGDNEVLLLRFI